MSGVFEVTISSDGTKIECDLIDPPPDIVPEEQQALREEVGKTLIVLTMLFEREKDQERFVEYFRPLVSIARDGLEGPNARPDVARRALADFQYQVTTREGGRVKHRYMKRLAKYTGIPSAIFLVVALSLLALPSVSQIRDAQPVVNLSIVANFCLLIAGCTAGVWLSFGARRPTLTFYELHIPEPDQLHPAMRVAFATALTVIVSVLFHLKAIKVQIGDVATEAVFTAPLVAWLIGALSGFSEQLLSQQVTAQASRLFTAPRNPP